MKKQTHSLVFIVNLLFYIIASGSFAASSPWNFSVDLSYEKTDQTQPDETTIDFTQEYRLMHNISLSLETKMETELRAEVEQEDRKGSDEPDTRLCKPYADFQMKSRLYDFGLGYRGSEEKTDITTSTNEGFVNFKLQPELLPEVNFKYDFKGEKESNDQKTYFHDISISSLYNIQDFLRIRLDYQGEYTDNRTTEDLVEESTNGDIKENNFLGQITFKHFLLRDKLRFALDYKVEKDDKKDQDPNNDFTWVKSNDQLIQTVNSQITYTITPSTNLYAQYEKKHTKDRSDDNKDTTAEADQKDSFRMDISQKICSYLMVLGKYRAEKNKNDRQDEKIDAYEAEINANPQRWLDLQGRAQIESRQTDDLLNDTSEKNDTQTVEGTWNANFPHLFDAQNTFNVRLMKEKKDDQDSRRERHYKWRLQIVPIVNLRLTPEYDILEEKDYLSTTTNNNENKDTHEFRTTIAYGLSFSQHLRIDLSNSLSRKRVKENGTLNKENNDDTKLDFKFTPTQNLIFSSQIIRQGKKIYQSGVLTQDEVDTSYALNYDWRFDPFTWSSSFKYDDRNQKQEGDNGTGDTETVESRITYKPNRNYDFTMNYKYTKTYSVDNDKEHTVGFQVRAFY
ncbi:MAG: hypothetical protein AB1847_11765 [bacterium]